MNGAVLAGVAGLLLAVAAGSVGVAAATVSQLELSRWVQYRLRGADVVARLRDDPSRVVGSANALTTLGLILAAATLPTLVEPDPSLVRVGVVLLLVIPAFLAAAYVIPRVVGRRWAESLTRVAVPWMDRAARLLGPILPHREPSPQSALAAVLAGSDTHALTTTSELAVVSGVLAFTDRPVREFMTPRTQIVALPEGMLTGEAAHVFAQSGYNRYPVYRESLDDIVGIVHALDLLRTAPDAPIPVRPALLVPETTQAGGVLREMRRAGSHVVIVLDEFGGTAGLVTFDDLLRSLVADVLDEPGAKESEGDAAPTLAVLAGGAPADELTERFGVTITDRTVRTVGGVLALHLGRIPQAGERLVFAGLEFDVLEAGATRVERVAVRPAPVRPIVLDGGGES